MFASTLVVAFTLTAPVPKSLVPALQWRLAKGDSFYVTCEDETASEATGFVPIPSEITVTKLVYKLTVTAADDKSTRAVIEVVSFSSGQITAGNGPPELTEYKNAARLKVTFAFDREWKVKETKIDPDPSTADGNFSIGELQPEYLPDRFTEYLRAMPGKRLDKGDTWKSELVHPDNGDVTYSQVDRGTVTDVTADRITLAIECDRTTKGKGPDSLELKSENGKRTVEFDPKAGRMRKLTDEYTLDGEFGMAGQRIQIKNTRKAAVAVTDEKPKGGK